MKIAWPHDWDMKGNGYGYSNHTRMMKQYLQAEGVQIDNDADIAVHILVPTGFQPIEGKYNILFTMYEAETLPEEWIEPLNKADMIVVPCDHNKRLFSKYTKLPIRVCQEGFQTEKFTPKKREYPQRGPFVFLWLGASNPRKGYEHLCYAWQYFAKQYPEECNRAHLIMKTTQVTRKERTFKAANTTFISEDYSLDQLIALYENAHCFVFPTMGEGWGLTLMEAAATGLPSIYTPYSGVNDFMKKDLSYTLKWKFRKIQTKKIKDDGTQEDYHSTYAASADIQHLTRRLAQVMNDYERASTNAMKLAHYLHKNFDWKYAAKRFIEILEEAKNGL